MIINTLKEGTKALRYKVSGFGCCGEQVCIDKRAVGLREV